MKELLLKLMVRCSLPLSLLVFAGCAKETKSSADNGEEVEQKRIIMGAMPALRGDIPAPPEERR